MQDLILRFAERIEHALEKEDLANVTDAVNVFSKSLVEANKADRALVVKTLRRAASITK